MSVAYAYLCRFAEVNWDGTYDTQGAGLDTVRVDAIPATASMAIVANVKAMGVMSEESPPIVIVLNLNYPDGESQELVNATMRRHPITEENRQGADDSANVIVNLGLVPLEAEGKHTFIMNLKSDQKQLEVSLSFFVILRK